MAASSSGSVSQLNMRHCGPRVSIGMPVFNGESFLAQTLDSILAQTFKDFEIVISDNASTDRTDRICQSYAARDPRVRYYRSDANQGAAWNHNRVFELARGEYFKWQSHDDLCAPEFLEACVSVLDQDPEVVLCFTRAHIIDAENRIQSKYHVPAMIRMDSPHPHERFHGAICPDHWCFQVYGLTRNDVLRQTPLIASYTASDRVLLADLALRGRFHEIPAYWFFNREHESRSFRVHSLYTMAGWFDPKLKGKMTFPHWRLLLEYGRTVARCSRLDRQERMHCYVQLFPWLSQYWTKLVADIRAVGMAILRKISPRTGDLVSRIVHEGPRSLFVPTSRIQGEKSKRNA